MFVPIGARPVERDERRDVSKLAGQRADELCIGSALELEHAVWVASEGAQGLWIVERDRVDVDALPVERSMISSVTSMTSRLRRREVILRSPSSPTPFICTA